MSIKTLAIIPARGGSKRLPGKNIRPFLGKPLIHWTIEFAQQLPYFDKVVVSTDSDEIADCCGLAGLRVESRRPAALATDEASSVDVVLDVLSNEVSNGFEYDFVALLQPTSPIRESARWYAAFELIEQGAHDAVIGVSPVRDHPLHVFRQGPNGELSPWIDGSWLELRSQELPTAVCVNGSLYLIRVSTLRNEKSFFPVGVKSVLCDRPYENVDIDTEADWVVAEALAAFYKKQP